MWAVTFSWETNGDPFINWCFVQGKIELLVKGADDVVGARIRSKGSNPQVKAQVGAQLEQFGTRVCDMWHIDMVITLKQLGTHVCDI